MILVERLGETGGSVVEEGELRGGKRSSMTGREGDDDCSTGEEDEVMGEVIKYCQSWVIEEGFLG
jgi:hypothetical protein